MFDPGEKQKITIRHGDGTSWGFDGHVTSTEITQCQDGPTEMKLGLVASGPVTFNGDFVPDPPPPDDITADIKGEPHVMWGSDGPPRPYRPWSWETCMIVVAAVCWLAGWPVVFRAIWKCVL